MSNMEKAMSALNATSTQIEKIAAHQSLPGTNVNPSGNGAKTETAAPSTELGGVEATTSTPPSPTKEEPKKIDELASKFSALAKREKTLVRQAQEIKAKEASFAEREAALAVREAKIKEADDMWDKDIFKSLEMRGLDYNKLTKRYLEGNATPEKQIVAPEVAAAKVIEEFEKKQAAKEAKQAEELKKKEDEQAAKEQEQLKDAYAKFHNEVATFIKANEAEYELTNLYDQSDLVVQTIQEHFDVTQEVDSETGAIIKPGKVLSIKEASSLVEAYLEDLAKKTLSTKKFGKPALEKTEEKKSAFAPSKTLSNNLTPTIAGNLPARNEQDRMKRAMAKLNAQK